MGKWKPATLINEDAVDPIKKLKEQPGKDIINWGSISLAQSLMKANLIEYHLRICPSVIGKGKPLFSKDTATFKLNLFNAKVYKSGLVLLQYMPAG